MEKWINVNILKAKALEETKSFYLMELQNKELTELQKEGYLKAKKIIEGLIKEKKEARVPGYRKKIKVAIIGNG